MNEATATMVANEMFQNRLSFAVFFSCQSVFFLDTLEKTAAKSCLPAENSVNKL